MPTTSDQAIAIRHWDWSETSQTVSLFARQLGMIRALAKGARRPKAPFSGGIEPLALGTLHVILKPPPALATLTAWHLTESFPPLRSSLHAHHAGLYVADLIQHFFKEHDPHPAAFDAALATLRALHQPQRISRAILAFQWTALQEAGFRPDLDAPNANVLLFDPHAGRFLPDRRPAPSHAWRVRASTLHALRQLDLGLEPDSSQSVDRANRLLAAWAAWILGHSLHTAHALFGDSVPQADPP